MGSRSRTATRLDKHARFVAVVARALTRPITDFKPFPVRPAFRRARGTSARNESENPYFHVDEAGA